MEYWAKRGYTFLPIFHSIAEYQFQINNNHTRIRSLNIAVEIEVIYQRTTERIRLSFPLSK